MGVAVTTPAAVLERAAYEDALGNRRTADMLRALVKVHDADQKTLNTYREAQRNVMAERDGARAKALDEAAQAADRVGRPVGAGDGCGTYIPGTSGQAAAAIRALKDKEART